MKNWKKYILSWIWSILLIAQLVLASVFSRSNESRIDVVMYVGWVIWVFSVVLGWLPMFNLKKRGGVSKGESYTKTTVLVNRGLYAIIRHPQYTAGLLFSLALILISQTWLICALGAGVFVLLYIDILRADRHEIEKFGDDYKIYMKQVPRVNFILGIARLIKRRCIN